MKRVILFGVAAMLAAAALAGSIAIASAAKPEAAFWVDGELYGTVGTSTDFSDTRAPADTYDTIYAIEQQRNVAEAAPGDTDFNGGRWMVRAVIFTDEDYDSALADDDVDLNDNDVLDSAEEVEAALALDYATDGGIVRIFECPVIHLPKGS